jgi:antitoxin MazE
MIVSKLGEDLAVKLDDHVVESLGLKEGDDVEIDVRRASPAQSGITPKMDPEEWLKRMSRFRGMLPADFKFNRDEANER